MDYNQFHYYRRKIYFKNGAISHANPSSVSHIPEGGDDFQHVGRKHFLQRQMEAESFMQPEKFANNNKMSLQKSYERNLKTLDIEGAKTNPIKSSAVRNKMKAQEELIRQQKEMNRYDEIKKLQQMEKEQQKKMIEEQYKKNQYFSSLISGKYPYEQKNKEGFLREKRSMESERGSERRKSSEENWLSFAGKNILNQ